MLGRLHNRVCRVTQRLLVRRSAAAAAAGAAVLLLTILAVVPPSGPAAVAASRLAVTVRLTDRGCTLPRTVRSRSLRIRVVNRGRYGHTFTIAGHRASPHPGRETVLRVSFPRPGR